MRVASRLIHLETIWHWDAGRHPHLNTVGEIDLSIVRTVAEVIVFLSRLVAPRRSTRPKKDFVSRRPLMFQSGES